MQYVTFILLHTFYQLDVSNSVGHTLLIDVFFIGRFLPISQQHLSFTLVQYIDGKLLAVTLLLWRRCYHYEIVKILYVNFEEFSRNSDGAYSSKMDIETHADYKQIGPAKDVVKYYRYDTIREAILKCVR